jgi:hypothetical protein
MAKATSITRSFSAGPARHQGVPPGDATVASRMQKPDGLPMSGDGRGATIRDTVF